MVLAFYPNARGFAYVLFEGPQSLVDWGISDVPSRRKRRASLEKLSVLLEQYRPDIVVLREVATPYRREGIEVYQSMKRLCKDARVPAAGLSRLQIRAAFAYLGSPSRGDIAKDLGRIIPGLSSFTPPERKIWKAEDRRMGLFDAAALAIAFFSQHIPL